VASQGMTTFRKMQWASQQHGPVWRNVPMAVTQLERSLRAWERFFATGDVEAADIRDEILRSWKRCYERASTLELLPFHSSRTGKNCRRR
jgi:hypothetical protein